MKDCNTFLAYDENGDLKEFNTYTEIVECPSCHKQYRQTKEEQIPGFRDMDYDQCPYCDAINHRSMEFEFHNSKME